MKQHQTLRRGLSILLALLMCLTLLPATALAAGTGTGKAIQPGTTQIEGGQASSVYFGNYQQSSDGSGSFNNDPIKWRVLSNADRKLFLLADQNLDVQQFHNENTAIIWAKSTIRSWLNGYGAIENSSGTDYSSNNFIDTAFSGEEQGAIAQTYVYNATQSDGISGPNPDFPNVSGGSDTTDKVFLLSIEEATSSSNFPNGNSSRISTNTAYVANYSTMADDGAAGYWWLRSPGKYVNGAAQVQTSGKVGTWGGNGVTATDCAVRPAFNLDPDAVLFASAAEDGKSANGMDSGLTAVGDYTGNEWKLTLLDESRSEFTASTTAVSDNTLTVQYENAETGSDEYVSAIVRDADGNVSYYGRIAQLDGTTNGASGTVSITLPAGFNKETDTISVFNEQYNGDKKTDYASDFCTVDSFMQKYEIAEAEVGVTAPLKGAAPAATGTVSDGRYYAATLDWDPMETAFEEGTAYTVQLELKTNRGYIFTSETVFKINGNNATVISCGEDQATISYTFPTTTSESCSHKKLKLVKKAATCTGYGTLAHYECEKCGQWFEDITGIFVIAEEEKEDYLVDPTGHSFDSEGVCKDCGYKKPSTEIDDDSSDSKREKRSYSNRWVQDARGWWYRNPNGTWPSNGWAYLPWNGSNYWYYFDADGYMVTSWLDWQGNRYYLNPVPGTNSGKMLTGWQLIDGKWYYFNTEKTALEGAMLRNTMTPDGYQVGADGVWIP